MNGIGRLRGPDDDPVPSGEPDDDEVFEDDDDDFDEDDEDGDYEQEDQAASPSRSRNV